MYRNSQKHESTLLHTYVMNEFLTAERSYTVNNKKTRTPCFSTLRFPRISPEPLDLQKIY